MYIFWESTNTFNSSNMCTFCCLTLMEFTSLIHSAYISTLSCVSNSYKLIFVELWGGGVNSKEGVAYFSFVLMPKGQFNRVRRDSNELLW